MQVYNRCKRRLGKKREKETGGSGKGGMGEGKRGEAMRAHKEREEKIDRWMEDRKSEIKQENDKGSGWRKGD